MTSSKGPIEWPALRGAGFFNVGWRIACVLGLMMACLWATTPAQAQRARDRRAAERLYQSALDQLRARRILQGRSLLLESVRLDSTQPRVWALSQEVAKVLGDDALWIRATIRLADIAEASPDLLQKGDLPARRTAAAYKLLERGQYAAAAQQLIRARALVDGQVAGTPPIPVHPTMDRRIDRGLASARFAQQAIREPRPFDRRPLPPNVNRFAMQYTPSATANDSVLVFTARRTSERDQEDIFLSRRLPPDGRWSDPEPLPPVINTRGNEGTSSISGDGRTMVFTSCHRSRAYGGGCDIFITRQTGGVWSEPEALDSVNTGHWESHPSLSADGNSIYFVSDRPGGYGKYDLYTSQRGRDGRWGAAQNLGPLINTEENEIMPYIHPNGRSLFFSSDGHVGMGGHDLYVASRPSPGAPFDTVQNLGYPLNTHRSESSIVVSPDGRRGYITVEEKREQIYLSSLLFELTFTEPIALPAKAAVVEGTVRDRQTGIALPAFVELSDNESGQTIYRVRADSVTGRYLMALPGGAGYGLEVSHPGYLFQSRYFDERDQSRQGVVRQDFLLEPLTQGARTILSNVFFDTDSDALLPASRTELDRVVAFMRQNARVRVEVSGHTDNVGTAAYNQGLSDRRARAVVSYLTARGVAAARVLAVGRGATMPLAGNESEEGRAQNRRIEFKIL